MKVKQGDKGKKKPVKEPSPIESESEEAVEDHDVYKVDEAGLKKPKTEKATTFSSYISKVKKQVHPDMRLSKSTVKIMDSFIEDFFTRLCTESSNLMMSVGNKSLRAEDVLRAITLILPGEIGSHAVSEASKAISAYEMDKESRKSA
ncbi:hypothetical protein SteCoe_20745 [Stentor coeruleus]|uniref:Core Histone H2A/H2B/H3 domain-containing protein n=1 Tax=Stentor coeruleus TaxID=5963 RepID=A0A1R2BRA3_9CILI|nr:hypothetical protein SteCoe_20745 [Stentor coeruleus]